MSEAATDAEALKKAEKERRRAEYAGKTFEKAPKQSQKEKNKEKKLAAQAGGERVKPGNKTETKSAGAATTTTPGGGGGVRRNSIDGNVNVKSHEPHKLLTPLCERFFKSFCESVNEFTDTSLD